jgi:hypothetical protein
VEDNATRMFRRLKHRLVVLERASEARERAMKKMADELGAEIDLTRMPTAEEEYLAEMTRTTTKHLLASEEVQAYLRESREEESQ